MDFSRLARMRKLLFFQVLGCGGYWQASRKSSGELPGHVGPPPMPDSKAATTGSSALSRWSIAAAAASPSRRAGFRRGGALRATETIGRWARPLSSTPSLSAYLSAARTEKRAQAIEKLKSRAANAVHRAPKSRSVDSLPDPHGVGAIDHGLNEPITRWIEERGARLLSERRNARPAERLIRRDESDFVREAQRHKAGRGARAAFAEDAGHSTDAERPQGLVEIDPAVRVEPDTLNDHAEVREAQRSLFRRVLPGDDEGWN